MVTIPHPARARSTIGVGMAALALLLTACTGDSGDPVAETTATETPSPTLTAPPTQTPEEVAEAEIIDTFEGIVTARDDFTATADTYTKTDVSNGEPVTNWHVTGGGELELTNQLSLWRETDLLSVGETVIASHDVSDQQLDASDDVFMASSSACLDITDITFTDYDGEPTEPPFEPDPSQTWIMEWQRFPEADPEAGIEEPGWHLSELEMRRGTQPCQG